MTAAVETMMYVGETPWHGEGTYVGENNLTAVEALKAAGLDWEVEKIPYPRVLASGEVVASKTSFEIRRKTDEKELGAVGPGYDPLQPVECFDFLDGVIEGGEVLYHTAGSLEGGSCIWALAKVMRDPLEVVPGDVVEDFLLISTRFDGRGSTKVIFTPTRVVCCNTLAWALQGAKSTFSLRHTTNQRTKLEDARKALGLAEKQRDSFAEAAKFLSAKQLTSRAQDAFLEHLFPSDGDGPVPTRTANMRQEVKNLIVGGKGQDIPGVKGTAWAGLNGLTEYTNHHRTSPGDSERIKSVWFGSGKKLAMQATQWLLNYDEAEYKPQYVMVNQVAAQPAAQSAVLDAAGSRFGSLEW